MSKGIKVVLVDDEEDFRQLMTFWLESKGYSVIPASDGKSAIQIVKENSPDIMFLDLHMPVMDGVGALKKIREFHTLRRVNPRLAPRNYEARFINSDGDVKDVFLTVAITRS